MDLFAGLKSFFKTDVTAIDNNVFRLHYKVTAVVLIAFSILVTGRQYIGDPIDCISKDDIPPNLLDTFCWIHTTFSLPDAWFKKVGEEVPYPGVDKYTPGEKRVYHAYYQWVCFVLFLQAILFYIPRYFWKAMEGGRIKNLILGLNSPILPEETKTSNRKLLVEYMTANLNNHSMYFFWFVLAEMMNFVNVVGQIFLMDAFLGGEFSTYGSKVLQFTNWDWSVRYDPMIKVFPRLTKCTFHRYGSSGDVQRHDAMCILPINIINEKIYVFLWFWFIILAVLSGLALVYRGFIVFFPRSRFLVTRSRARLANQDYLESIINKCKLGDWLLLDLLSKNLDPLNFRDVVNDFARKLDGKSLDNI
ncbi:innexin inx2 [Trichonephila clavipes]|uniref:Innexin n=2 Tax=Trichonephila TaxID=2585208 RepID=A0A8X6Y6D6_9ARAC|nr:innexin inx2 [Trichonephila clavipes]GFY65709.1 innexin inx2 [Trichonephila inaurata madagascariensis]